MASQANLIKYASRLTIYMSLVWLVTGILFTILRQLVCHMASMASGILIGFVAGIAASYIASGAGRYIDKMPAPITMADIVAPPALAASPLIPCLGLGLRAWGAYVAVFSALMVAPALWSSRKTRGLVRLSLLGVAATQLILAAYGVTVASTTARLIPLLVFFGVSAAYPIPMIYSVTVNSFPSTYRIRPFKPLYAVAMVLTALSIPLLLSGMLIEFEAMLAASMVAYALGTGVYRVHDALKAVENVKGIVRKTHIYFLQGHVFVLASIANYVALVAMNAYGVPVTLIAIIHAVTVGFIGMHIYIHAPLMVPVIMGIRTARRYNVAPYTLLLLAALSYMVSKIMVWVMLVSSLAALVYIVWPPPRK